MKVKVKISRKKFQKTTEKCKQKWLMCIKKMYINSSIHATVVEVKYNLYNCVGIVVWGEVVLFVLHFIALKNLQLDMSLMMSHLTRRLTCTLCGEYYVYDKKTKMITQSYISTQKVLMQKREKNTNLFKGIR